MGSLKMSEPLTATASQDGKTKIKIEKMESLKSAALNPKSKKRKVKKEKDSPMLLMRAPPPPRGYSVRRVLDLSKPKKNYGANHVCYYNQRILDSSRFKFRETSERIKELAKSKMEKHIKSGELDPAYTKYSCGLQTPIWKVAESAKQYKCGDRLLCLAKPKSYDDIYIPDRNVCNIIAPAVLSASCTSRIQALAKPKRSFSADHHYIDSRQPEDPITNVSRQARMHQASERTEELSRAKFTHSKFNPPNLHFWHVKRSALKAECPARCDELAKPLGRPSINEINANPNAFMVTSAAQKAQATPRIEELAIPKRKNEKRK